MDALQQKYEHLKRILQAHDRIAVAFSAGVDSTFLLKAAHDCLGDRVLAVTVRACTFPAGEQADAAAFCASSGIRHITPDFDPFSVDGFQNNPPDRCYLCKRAMFGMILQTAAQHGFTCVAEGSNADDCSDYRPGMRAIRELGVQSPLLDAGLTKQEIRLLSEQLHLPTWDKPSFACLATRFVYGETITKEKLYMVEQAENALFSLGFRQVRVRVHGTIARIEVERTAFDRILDPVVTDEIHARLTTLGFSYVTLDLAGYRTGSMNRYVSF